MYMYIYLDHNKPRNLHFVTDKSAPIPTCTCRKNNENLTDGISTQLQRYVLFARSLC